MTTQLLIRIDSSLKKEAMKKAQNDGVALSTVLKLATKAYINGDFDIQLVPKDELKASMKKKLEQSLDDIKHNRNVSKAFSNAEDAIRHLKML